MVHIHNGILLSHRKNAFESVLMRWMNLLEADKPQRRLLRSELAAPASLHRRETPGRGRPASPEQARDAARTAGKGEKAASQREQEHLSSAFPLVPVGEGIPATPRLVLPDSH